MEMHLPDAKVKNNWHSGPPRKPSLTGKLSHAAKIVLPGRIFLRSGKPSRLQVVLIVLRDSAHSSEAGEP